VQYGLLKMYIGGSYVETALLSMGAGLCTKIHLAPTTVRTQGIYSGYAALCKDNVAWCALDQVLLDETWTEMHIDLDEGCVANAAEAVDLTNWTSSYG
jgi:hypothetical protein